MKRRKFLELSASAGILSFFNAHLLTASMACAGVKKKDNKKPLISSIRLLTHSSPGELKEFYTGLIGFPLVSESSNEITFRTGQSLLTFIKTEGGSRPFYHFAFNIPENKIQKAFDWQRKKTEIIHLNPAGAKDEIVHFSHWNAHSVFFLDPAGNLVEYIARHTMNNAAGGDFTVNDIMYISEIGFISNNVEESGRALIQGSGIKEYQALSNTFWPIGDEHGLLLMINKGREWTGKEGQRNITDIFKTSVSVNTGNKNSFAFPGYPYEISAV